MPTTSFASMLTSTPKLAWPSLNPVKTQNEQLKYTQVTGSKQTVNTSRAQKSNDSDDEFNSDGLNVQPLGQSLGSVIADALKKAENPKKKNATSKANITPSTNGKKKKNKKSTVLFSTGMNFQ